MKKIYSIFPVIWIATIIFGFFSVDSAFASVWEYIIYSNTTHWYNIYRKSASDTSNGTAITNNTAYYLSTSPDWQYVYYWNANDGGKIYKKNVSDTSNWSAINSVSVDWLCVEPDGNNIIYAAGWYLYRKSSNDTSNWTAITGNVWATYPNCSPDSLYVYYKNSSSYIVKKLISDWSAWSVITPSTSNWTSVAFSSDWSFMYWTNTSGNLYKKSTSDTLLWTSLWAWSWDQLATDWSFSKIAMANGWPIYLKDIDADNSTKVQITTDGADFIAYNWYSRGSCIDWIQNQDETSIDYGGVCWFRTNGCEKQWIVLYDSSTNTQTTPTFSDSWSNTGVTESGWITTIIFYDVSSYNIDQILIQNYSWDSRIDYRSFQGTDRSSYKTRLAAPVTSTTLSPQITYAGVRWWQDVEFNYIRFKSSQTNWVQSLGKSGVVWSAIFYWPKWNSFVTTMTSSWWFLTAVAQQRGTDIQKYTYVIIQFFKFLTVEIEWFEVWLANKITSNTFNCSNWQYVCSFKQNNYWDNVYCGSTYFDKDGKDIWACTSQNWSWSFIVDKYTGVKETIWSGSLVCTTSIDPTAIPKVPWNTTAGYTTDASGNVVISDPEVANPFVEKDCVIDWWTTALSCAYDKIKSFFGIATDSANSIWKIAKVTSEVWKATQSWSSSWSLWSSGSDNGNVPILSGLANKYRDMANWDSWILSDQFLAIKWWGIALMIIWVIVLFIFLIRQ